MRIATVLFLKTTIDVRFNELFPIEIEILDRENCLKS